MLKGRTSDQITLTLSPDGEFKEHTVASGNFSSVAGTWSVRDGNIDFDRLWIPPAFAPQYILHADNQALASGKAEIHRAWPLGRSCGKVVGANED